MTHHTFNGNGIEMNSTRSIINRIIVLLIQKGEEVPREHLERIKRMVENGDETQEKKETYENKTSH